MPNKVFNVREFENEKDAISQAAKTFHLYQATEEEINLIADAYVYITRERLKKLLNKKLDEVGTEAEGYMNDYERDKNQGWREALEWLLELFE